MISPSPRCLLAVIGLVLHVALARNVEVDSRLGTTKETIQNTARNAQVDFLPTNSKEIRRDTVINARVNTFLNDPKEAPHDTARDVQVDSILDVPKELIHFTEGGSSPDNVGCPKAEAIAPCVCTAPDGILSIKIYCIDGNITNSDLGKIFSKPFPYLDIWRITIKSNNSELTELGDIFANGATFEHVDITSNILQNISPSFLANSTDRLMSLSLTGAKINETTFPFETLGNYKNLNNLIFKEINFMETIPPFDAPALDNLFFAGLDDFKYLTPGWNKMMPKLKEIVVTGTKLQRLEKNALPLFIHNALYLITLSGNQIDYIDPEAFVLPGVDNSTILTLDLGGNRLNTTVEEEVFRPLLDKTGRSSIDFGDDPAQIQCHNCSMKWVFERPHGIQNYLEMLYGTCQEGMKIGDLQYDWFEEHCHD